MAARASKAIPQLMRNPCHWLNMHTEKQSSGREGSRVRVSQKYTHKDMGGSCKSGTKRELGV